MIKIFGIIAGFLALWCVYLNFKVDALKNENMALQTQKNALVKAIKDFENAKIESDKTIKMLREAANKSQANINWYNECVPDDVLNVLQKRHLARQAN